MKKALIFICVSLIMLCAFVGCGTANEMMNDAETMVSEVASDAKDMIDGEDSKNNGTVTDDDGFIQENENSTNDTTASTSGTKSAAIENNTNTNSTNSTNSTRNTNETIV